MRLDIAYDGTGFSGWSRQPGLRTVQGELESALATILSRAGEPPTLTVAGRTDAGVHALGQVAHLDLTDAQLAALDDSHRGKGGQGGQSATVGQSGQSAQSAQSAQTGRGAQGGQTGKTGNTGQTGAGPDRSPEARVVRLARRLNGIAGLHSDLYVSAASIAPSGFDARFSAIWRRYEYRIADRVAQKNPLLRSSTLWYPGELDVAAMSTAAAPLLGLHDFAAYCKPREGATTIRTLQRLDWTRDDSGVILARLQADAFCHSMVRALVGASIAAGAGTLAPERVGEILEAAVRTNEFKTVPARGLVLVQVGYPDDADLADRAEQTRARRDAASE